MRVKNANPGEHQLSSIICVALNRSFIHISPNTDEVSIYTVGHFLQDEDAKIEFLNQIYCIKFAPSIRRLNADPST